MVARSLTAGVFACALLLVGACTPVAPGPASPQPDPGWSRIPLPSGMQPSSLAASGQTLLVGGRRGDGDRAQPVLVSLTGRGSAKPVRLRPTTPYAKVADLVSLAVDGDRLFALGAAHGGAHANFRWTVWTGSPGTLVEHPQTFETFGGQSAGSLLDIVATDDGAVIAGSWSNAGGTGLDAAVWLPKGETWQLQPSAGTALANTASLQVAPRAAIADGPAVELLGSVISFAGGVQQHAAVWTWPARNRSWTLAQLPQPGKRSEALSAACAATCWVAGYVDGELAVWRLGGASIREAGLPSVPVDADGPGPRVALAGGEPVVLVTSGSQLRVLRHHGESWQQSLGPDGTVRDAAVVGDLLYAVLDVGGTPQLWRQSAG